MARREVRAAVVKWLSEPQITTLNQIFTSFPKRINFQVNSFPGQNSRAAGVVFISGETESRLTIGGAYDGWKRVDYTVDFQIFHHSSAQPEEAMDDFDELIDAVKNQLRAGGHRLGLEDGSVIWQAAEPGIDINYSEPSNTNGTYTETWASIRFTVTQMIRA